MTYDEIVSTLATNPPVLGRTEIITKSIWGRTIYKSSTQKQMVLVSLPVVQKDGTSCCNICAPLTYCREVVCGTLSRAFSNKNKHTVGIIQERNSRKVVEYSESNINGVGNPLLLVLRNYSTAKLKVSMNALNDLESMNSSGEKTVMHLVNGPDGKNWILLVVPSFWVTSVPMLSLYLLIVRMMHSRAANVKTSWAKYIGCIHSLSKNRLSRQGKNDLEQLIKVEYLGIIPLVVKEPNMAKVMEFSKTAQTWGISYLAKVMELGDTKEGKYYSFSPPFLLAAKRLKEKQKIKA